MFGRCGRWPRETASARLSERNRSSVRCSGGEGGGGDNVHANATCVFFFCWPSSAMWWCGAVVGEEGGGDDVHATATCVFLFLLLNFFCPYWSQSFWWSFQDTCCLAFHTSTMQKPRVFAVFQTKTSKMTLNLNLKKHEKHGICDTFAKNATKKNKNEEHWKTKTPTHRVVDENLAKYKVFLISTKKTSQK